MTISVINATEAALGLDPDIRDCYKSKDFFFKYMSYDVGFRYSMANCLYEAVLEAILDKCQCLPNFVNFEIKGDKVPTLVCRGKYLTCAREWLNNIGNDNYDGVDLTMATTNSTDGTRLKCRERCEAQTQQLMSTSSSYPNRQTFPYRQDFCLVMKKVIKVCQDAQRSLAFAARYSALISCTELLNANENGMCTEKYPLVSDITNNKRIVDFIFQYSADNIAVVKLFIRDPYYTNIKKDVQMTFISFLGNAGGLAGLCMGFSLVSFFEVIFHIFKCFGRCCGKRY